jgi:DNA-directed RNA polymerase specialized sigma24 family protein
MPANQTVTELDRRLYAWLAEPNDQRFERAFATYFGTAFPVLLRHLARLSRWDPANLEELAQDALLRFFDKVGRGRREASELIKTSLIRVRPLNMGAFHERQVNRWTQDTEAFRETAMTFRLSPNMESADVHFKSGVQALTSRIRPLQERGDHLLHAVRIDLKWVADDKAVAATSVSERPAADAGDASGSPIESQEGRDVESAVFARSLADEASAQSNRAIIAEKCRPGVTQFVSTTVTVVHHLPSLRVPTNGYLFEIALTIYLDECKKRGRVKRGGSGFQESDGLRNGDGEIAMHPIERLDAEFEAIGSAGEYFELDDLRPAYGTSSNSPRVPSTDPTRQYEDAEFLEKFYAYLRRPLDEAAADCERARAKGRATAELKKFESVSTKFERTIAVLTLMGEGHTQEQIAERLTLSRNQVKYVIELVQESYSRFAALSTSLATPAANAGVQHHG